MDEVQKKKVINYQKLLESEKIRSEDYFSKLKYLQADYLNLKNRTDLDSLALCVVPHGG